MVADVVKKNGGRITHAAAAAALEAAGWRRQKGNPKLRYLKQVGRGTRNAELSAIFKRDRVPYPKRGE